MLCCLLALFAMMGAVFAHRRRLICGLAAMLMIGGASATLAWSSAWPASHAHHEHTIPVIYWVDGPERPMNGALRDVPK
jgi:hypothetical protein